MNSEENQIFELSHAQQRILFVEQTYLDTPINNNAAAVRYLQPLEYSLLEQAINTTLKKNDGLRLRLLTTQLNGVYTTNQFVHEYQQQAIEVMDFVGVHGCLRENTWLENKTCEVIPLYDHDLFYFALCRFHDKADGYFFKLHHIIADGWTCYRVINEIDAIYLQLLNNNTPDLTSNPSYRNYVNDESDYLQSEQAAISKAFWHELLLPLPETHVLGGPTQTQDEDTKAGVRVFAFPDHIRTQLNAFCKQHKTSHFKVICSALAIFISRATGADDVVIGSGSHNRTQPIYKKMAGMFVSTFPIRLAPHPTLSFVEFVINVGRTLNHILKNHQKYPFDLLANEIREKTGANSRFLVAINLVGHPTVIDDRKTISAIFSGHEQADLTLHLNRSNRDAQGILELEWDYRLNMFSADDIVNMHSCLHNIIADGLTHADKLLANIQMLTHQDQQKILKDFNQTTTPFPRDATIGTLFTERVKQSPEKRSIVCNGKFYSYRELNERSNRLARTLQQHGVTADMVVALLLDRSLELIVGVLAIIKAGGAYVPIDPNYPTDRINYILSDCKTPLLLTRQSILKNIDFKQTIIDIDAPSAYARDDSDLPIKNQPHDLVYVIYTSGSTGNPKGVMIEHHSLVNLCYWTLSWQGLTPHDARSQFAAFGFDASVWEIFPTLLSGATLHIINDDLRLSVDELNQYFQANRITVGFLPTQFGEQFIELASNSSMRWLDVGGDKLRTFRKRPYKIVNNYGPTECTVIATSHIVERYQENISIGRPVANTHIYILDKFANLQPVAIPGELCIGGVGVARGYLNRDELTKERFVPDPFKLGKRMYRTGDLARWEANGEITFLGRIDQQVKIRGFRIELGEIEQALLSCDGVTDAAVIDRTDAQNNKYLAGYYVTSTDVLPEVINACLSARLPSYMIPQLLLAIETIPLTPNGKIDRKSLPATISNANRSGPNIFVPPHSAVEVALAKLWEEILGQKKISVNALFINLGGDSLKAAQMQARLNRDFEVSISLAQIFKTPTIKALAAFIQESTKGRYREIKAAATQTYYPLSSAQKRLFLVGQMDNVGTAYNIPLAYRITGCLDLDGLAQAIEKQVERHATLRTTFHIIDGEIVQQIHKKVHFKRCFREASAADSANILNDIVAPFDLASAPLFRFTLVKFEQDNYLFVFDVHHIIMDGLSVTTFIDELWELYQGNPVSAVTLQYHDYAVWQQQMMNAGVFEEQASYWLKLFADGPPKLQLPTDFPRPSVMGFSGGQITQEINKELTEKIKEFAKSQQCTPFMLLLTTVAVLLSQHSKQDDVVIGTPGAGRTMPGLANILGMFVNSIPIRTYPNKNKTFTTLLQETKMTLVQALDNQDFQFDALVERLALKRVAGGNPLFDVMFSWRAEESTVCVDNLQLEPWAMPPTMVKFDLTFGVIEKANNIELIIEYRDDLYLSKTIAAMLSDWINAITIGIADSEVVIKDINCSSSFSKQVPILAAIEPASIADADQQKQVGKPSANKINKIIKVWEDILGISSIKADDNFFTLGGHSINAVAAVAQLRKSCNISVNDIFRYQTAKSLAANISDIEDNLKLSLESLKASFTENTSTLKSRTSHSNTVYLPELAVYRSSIDTFSAGNNKAPSKPYQHILLTGATGFVGIYLLHSLLTNKKHVKVCVLVRGDSLEHAQHRIRHKLQYYFGNNSISDSVETMARLTVVCSDLTEPQLGLNKNRYDFLASSIDCIIHAAANVKHYGRFDDFYQANVVTTKHLLDMAKTQQIKDFHLISTLSVGLLQATDNSDHLFTEESIAATQQDGNHYLRTKQMAELEVIQARVHGIAANIYRIANITFASKTGVYQENIDDNAFFQRIRAYINLGIVPDVSDESDLSAVDDVARAILTLVDKPALANQTFHIKNPHTVNIAKLLTADALGLSVKRMGMAHFLDYLSINYDRPGLREYIETIMLHHGWMESTQTASQLPRLICSELTDAMLEKLNFQWPLLDIAKMQGMINATLQQRTSFLEKVPIFSELPKMALLTLAKQARLDYFPDTHALLWEGEPNHDFHIIMAGHVEISAVSRFGWVGTLRVLSAGDFIGEGGILSTDEPSSITAEAIVGDVRVLTLNCQEIKQLIQEHSKLGLSFLAALYKRAAVLEKLVVSTH